MTITTAFLTNHKKDLLNAAGYGATVTPTGDTTNGAATITSLSAMTGVYRGMGISGTGIPAGAVVLSIDSATQITISANATATNTGTTLTIAGDTWKMALIKSSPTGTYDATTTKYADVTGNSDEASGSGYTAGGQALSANYGAETSGTTAYTQWDTDPSWTNVTVSADGAMVYNTSGFGPTLNAAAGVFDFGGTVSVTGGTLTVLQPVNDNTHALFRLQ